MIATGIAIREYEPSDQPYFEKFNRAWIEKDFWMEPVDIDVLTKPETHILGHGGRILMATFEGEIAGTVALKYVDDKTYEFTKMAVDDRFRGKKIGLLLTTEALKLATRLGATRVILYSSTKLAPALALYRKVGFRDVPVDGPYKRSDVKMEILIA